MKERVTEHRRVEIVSRRTLHRSEAARIEYDDGGNLVVIIEKRRSTRESD